MASGSSSGEIPLDQRGMAPPLPSAAQRFEKLRHLGSGTFGEAWLAKSAVSQRHYVIKELKLTAQLTSKDREQTFNEVNIIRKCCHVNIIRYKDCFVKQSPMNVPILSIVMEYADSGDLHDCIKRHREQRKHFQEAQIRNWLVQITFALQYLHKNNILHRDLKTQNIFMTSTRLLKLGDFGISKTLSQENEFASTGIGTPQYLSPEICRQQKYDYKSDIWGLGCVLYEMCALQPAFPGADLATLVNNIVRGSYKPIPGQYSSNISELVKVMLRPDPSRRPSSEQLLGAKVLHSDVMDYMEYVRSLPDVFENGRKGSSSSASSAEGSNSAASASGGLVTLV